MRLSCVERIPSVIAQPKTDRLSRRDMLKSSAVAITAAVAGGRLVGVTHAGISDLPPAPMSAKRVLRFSHPTDIHVEPELAGDKGMAQAFQHMMSLSDPPTMILTGGDLPFDTADADHTRSAMLWHIFNKVLADNVPSSIPIHHTIGNHDIWGRFKDGCKATGKESFYGKNWFLENFNYPKTYYSFDQAGWHFIVLDSFDLDPSGPEYTSRIVGEQLAWFKADLAATPVTTPIIVVTHVPIVSLSNFFDHAEYPQPGPDITVMRTRMHVDHRMFDSLFQKYRNVKLCLSGHLHQLDKSEYNNVTYICDGAVCGDKWNGPRKHTPEGYSLIDLYADGTFAHQYVAYGWKAQKGKSVATPEANAALRVRSYYDL
jgi:3',5'-cyclic-AMP phosphodiesterase